MPKTLDPSGNDTEPAILFGENGKVIASSPYPLSWQQLKARFATSRYRATLAERFEAWVYACSSLVKIEQIWIGGSFCSDKIEPRDIDTVLFYRHITPMPDPVMRSAFFAQHADVLSYQGALEHFQIDSALLSLSLDPLRLIHWSAYWTMLLSGMSDGQRRPFYTINVNSLIK